MINYIDILNGLSDTDLQTLNIRYISEYDQEGEYNGIKAITYDGLNIGKNKTKNFAYVGFPKDGKENLPAVVLIHGGAGYPFLQWIKEWNSRGYAAIAISTEGQFPKRLGSGDCEGAYFTDWNLKLDGIFAEEGYVGTPQNDDMRLRDTQEIDTMWMYHAVSQGLLAYNIMASFDCIDKNKIGVIGISWGSVILSIMLGFKNKFAFAIPVYGSGYLDESLSFMRYKFILPRTQDLWLAQNRFENVKLPVLWICMNDDAAFSVNSNSKSYIDTVKNNSRTTLSIKAGWIHGHSCCWDTEHYPCGEIYNFADAIVKSGTFPCIISEPAEAAVKGRIEVVFDRKDAEFVCATLYYLTKPYEYSIPAVIEQSHPAHEWKTLNAAVKIEDGGRTTAAVTVPENATCCYMELKSINKKGTDIISTRLYNLLN